MRFRFSDVRRPARVSKLVRAEFAARGIPLGLTKAQDVCARLYGYPTYHELKACIGRGAQGAWDEGCTPGDARDRREWQVASLVADGLPERDAEAFVDRAKPTGASRHAGARAAEAPVPAGPQGERPRVSPDGIPVSGDGFPTRAGIVETLLGRALEAGASDIHFEPSVGGYSVYFRILGERMPVHAGPPDEHASVTSDIKVLARIDPEARHGQDGGFQVVRSGGYVDLRVATVPRVGGEDILLKVVPRVVRRDLGQVGIRDVETWRRAIGRKGGLCVICGDSSSDMTTTLNASLAELAARGKRVLADGGTGAARSVHDLMRADPDVLVLGELRDPDTAVLAKDVVLEGRSAIGMARSGNILSTLNRLRDLCLSRRDISRMLAGILVQDRVRTACKACSAMGEVAGTRCAPCSGTGHSGYALVSECVAFPGPDDVTEALGMAEPESRRPVPWAEMVDDLVAMVAAGDVSFAEAMHAQGSCFEERWSSRGMGKPPVPGRAR